MLLPSVVEVDDDVDDVAVEVVPVMGFSELGVGSVEVAEVGGCAVGPSPENDNVSCGFFVELW